MRASDLRHRITLLVKQITINPAGERIEDWQEIGQVWANFTPLSVKDVLLAGASGSQITARCVIRHRKDIHSAMRVKHNGNTYAITGQPLSDNGSGCEYLTLMLTSMADGNG